MREVMSFRLDAKAAGAARVRATAKGKKITTCLEDLVLSDLTAGPKSRPTLVEVIRLLRVRRQII